MINFCLYLVACVGMMSVRGSDDTCDSRIGYLIFLKGFNFNFAAMWHIPSCHIRG